HACERERRTRLASLRARVEKVVDGVEDADPRTLQTMLDQVERLGRLVQQLLDLSRLQSPGAPLARALFPLSDLLDRVAEETRAYAGDVNVVVAVEEPEPMV